MAQNLICASLLCGYVNHCMSQCQMIISVAALNVTWKVNEMGVISWSAMRGQAEGDREEEPFGGLVYVSGYN